MLAALYIATAVYALYCGQMLQIRWRRWLTERYSRHWLAGRAYYLLQLEPSRVENPEQRIQDDIGIVTSLTLDLLTGVINSLATLGSFVVMLWILSGTLPLRLPGISVVIPGYMVWVAILYAALGSVATHLVGRALIGINYDLQRYDAESRFRMIRGEPLSLIIVDLAHGDLDAVFSIRALAARSPNCQIVVIGSTEHAGIADRLVGLHVHGFFLRPIDFGALVARVSLLARLADDNSSDAGTLALSRCSAHVLAYFSAHYAESFSLHTLARAVGVSPGTLARVFLRDTKRSPRSFRCDVRVEVAKQLLVHEDHKLDRVAEVAGFVDGSHLSRVFRLHTGRSPGQYRVEFRSPRQEARCASG